MSSNARERLRKCYCPDRVQILFVGESPPASGRFFYQADYRAYHNVLRRYCTGPLPSFLYMSPERSAADGLVANVLGRNRRQISLIVIDEAHCVSQWGDTFRPLYRMIPELPRRPLSQAKRLLQHRQKTVELSLCGMPLRQAASALHNTT